MKNSGGLIKDLKPNAEIKLKNSEYVVRNEGLHTIRIRIYKNEETNWQEVEQEHDEYVRNQDLKTGVKKVLIGENK